MNLVAELVCKTPVLVGCTAEAAARSGAGLSVGFGLLEARFSDDPL